MTRPPTIPAFYTGAVLLAGATAWGQGEWILIDRDLRERRVELTQLRDDAVWFSDGTDAARSEPTAGLLAIIHERLPDERPPRELPWLTQQMEMFGQDAQAPEDEAKPFVATLVLTDGQRWVGNLAHADGESIAWSLPGSLPLEVALERVRSAAINGPVGNDGWSGIDDRVVLLNGDVIDGFIASVGQTVTLEGPGGEVRIPLARVAGVLLANPPSRPDQTLAWLADGSVIATSSVEVAATGRVLLGLRSDAPEAVHRIATSDLLALLFDPPLVSGLSEITPASIIYPPERLWGRPPRAEAAGVLGVGAIDMAGPVRVVWELPHPAARLGATATLPPAMWAWGDCEVVVRTSDETEILRERLRAERPSVEINLPLGGSRRISVEIASGEGGAVQDRVLLIRPIVRWQSTR